MSSRGNRSLGFSLQLSPRTLSCGNKGGVHFRGKERKACVAALRTGAKKMPREIGGKTSKPGTAWVPTSLIACSREKGIGKGASEHGPDERAKDGCASFIKRQERCRRMGRREYLCGPLRTGQGSGSYSAAETGSSHSLEASSPGTSTARWENQLSLAAPCQCLTPAGMMTTSPAWSSRAGLPHS